MLEPGTEIIGKKTGGGCRGGGRSAARLKSDLPPLFRGPICISVAFVQRMTVRGALRRFCVTSYAGHMVELRAPMNFPRDWSSFGPKMLALRERERRFVWAYLCNAMTDGQENGAQAARDAGYSDNKEGCKVSAHRMLHRDGVMEVINEVAAR